MNLKSRKKGITVAMAATMILIIALMTATVTIAVVKTVKGSNLKAFATELSLVQNTIQEFAFSGSINEYLSQDVTLTLTSTEQFEGETIENNTVLLHVLDLPKMGIEKSVYGIGKDGNTKDYYAVSLDTMKVYYIAGYDSGDKVYYTLTDELIQILNGENKAIYTNNILFEPNTVEWTNKPVTVKVLVPTRISTSTVTVSTNNSEITVSAAVANGSYNEYKVNTEETDGNYVITVAYTLDGSQKTETYTVSNFDNEAPIILMGNILNNNNSFYLNKVRALDNGRVKNIKYIEVDVAENDAKNFFTTGGTDLIGGKVKLSSMNAEFTIYAEDYAGNYTTSVVTVPDNFYYVGGTKDTGLIISDNAADEDKGVNYTCVGNQFVWVPVDDYSKFVRGTAVKNSDDIYKMTGTLSSTYIEPYTSNDWEVKEYNDMRASVKKYGGFYIARFEAGDGDATEARTEDTVAHTVVSKKGAYIYKYVKWGDSMTNIGTSGAVYLSQNMYKNSPYVVSTLCYGVQWDAVLNFVSDSDHPIAGSARASEDWSSDSHDVTGLSEKARTKNIYDIAGWCETWTMESSDSKRVLRSGYHYDGDSIHRADYRLAWLPEVSDWAVSSSGEMSFRPTLYIKLPEKKPVVPNGFYHVGGTWDSGYVISDNIADKDKGVDYTCVGNQFVWVPVDDYSKFVRGTAVKNSDDIYKMTGTLSSNYAEPYTSNNWEVAEYNAMCASVGKYGGFYIARFEAGKENNVVVSKKNVSVYTDVKWGDSMSSVGTTGAVYLAQNMYKNNESVVSTLCYGVQWDATMNYISDAEHSIVDSSSWGNYSASAGNAATNCGSLQKTGKNEAWQAKNIYDLAGNIAEWTMERGTGDNYGTAASSTTVLSRVLRGGGYQDYSSAMSSSLRASREPDNSTLGYNAATHAYTGIGFRVALYVK